MKTIKGLLMIGIGISLILSLYVTAEHNPHFFWEKMPGFDALFGFAGCTLIIIGSKVLGHKWLQKNEDYYE